MRFGVGYLYSLHRNCSTLESCGSRHGRNGVGNFSRTLPESAWSWSIRQNRTFRVSEQSEIAFANCECCSKLRMLNHWLQHSCYRSVGTPGVLHAARFWFHPTTCQKIHRGQVLQVATTLPESEQELIDCKRGMTADDSPLTATDWQKYNWTDAQCNMSNP
jgi:hypothetical protein